MPFIIVFLGLVLIVTGVKGTQKDLLGLIEGDFTGDNNFVYWLLSLFIVGSVGYIPQMKKIADTFMALIIITLIFRNGNFFENFAAQIKAGTATAPTPSPSSGSTTTTDPALQTGQTAPNGNQVYQQIPVSSVGQSNSTQEKLQKIGQIGSIAAMFGF